MTAEALISPEEFLALQNQEEDHLEYDEGRVLEVPEMTFEHGAIQARLVQKVSNWQGETGLPIAVSINAGFWLGDDRLRKPVVSIVQSKTLQAMPEYRGGLRGCPEIAVEVISDNEKVADIEEKTRLYLDAGAKAVWNIYPQSQTAVVKRPDVRASMLSIGEHLEDPDLLPGLRISVADLFR